MSFTHPPSPFLEKVLIQAPEAHWKEQSVYGEFSGLSGKFIFFSEAQRHPPGSLYQAQAGTEHWAVPVASPHPSTLETPEEEKDTPPALNLPAPNDIWVLGFQNLSRFQKIQFKTWGGGRIKFQN